jgi:hypothetical protein
MSQHTVFVIGGEDDELCIVETTPVDGLCHLVLTFRGRRYEASATDYFEALCHVRQELEGTGILLCCYGASLDVYPSGMCRDMSAGMKAYRLTKGSKPTRESLVGIFDSGHDVIPASVAAQKQHFDEWLAL